MVPAKRPVLALPALQYFACFVFIHRFMFGSMFGGELILSLDCPLDCKLKHAKRGEIENNLNASAPFAEMKIKIWLIHG